MMEVWDLAVRRSRRGPALFFQMCVRNRVECEGRMRVRGPSAHFRGDPYRFHDLLWRRPVAQRGSRVAADAIRALGHVRDGDRNQLLRFRGNRAVGEYAVAEGTECLGGGGRKPSPLFSDLASGFRIKRIMVWHGLLLEIGRAPRTQYISAVPGPEIAQARSFFNAASLC